MKYKVIYKLIGQYKKDSIIFEKYDELLLAFNQIRISGGLFNNHHIEGMEYFENIKIFEINYDNENGGTKNIIGISINENGEKEEQDFDVSTIDEIEIIENNITNKFNIDFGKYKGKELLTYDSTNSKLFYLGKHIHTFKESIGRKTFIKLIFSKEVNEILHFNEIQTEIDNGAIAYSLSKKQDKDIRNIIGKLNELLERKIKIKNIFSLPKNGVGREVYRII